MWAVNEDFWICPGCGAEVRVGGAGCPRCLPPGGRPSRHARQRTDQRERHSWEQDQRLDGLDLPDDDFNYDDFVAREFGKAPHRRMRIRWYWWATAIVLLMLMISTCGRV